MKLEGTKATLASFGFSVLIIVVGVVSVLTAETSRNPIRSTLRGGAMVVLGIFIIGLDIYSIIKSKKNND